MEVLVNLVEASISSYILVFSILVGDSATFSTIMHRIWGRYSLRVQDVEAFKRSKRCLGGKRLSFCESSCIKLAATRMASLNLYQWIAALVSESGPFFLPQQCHPFLTSSEWTKGRH